MIRRLHIEGWRAFEQLTLELDDGVTFIVAENGIGKTSLIQAASWGLFGALSGLDARAARRFGDSDVKVALDLQLPGGEMLAVKRTLVGRREVLDAELDGVPLNSDLGDVLASSFGASPEFLSRTTLLSSATVAEHAASVPQLHQHLCHVFGVDDLQHAAQRLLAVQRSAAAEAARHRQQTRQISTDIDQLRGHLTRLTEELRSAEHSRSQSRDAVEEAQRALSHAHAAQARREQIQSELVLLHDLLTDTDTVLGVSDLAHHRPTLKNMPRVSSALRQRLEQAEDVARERLDNARAEFAVTTARLAAVQDGMTELHGASDECPVCRRELTPDDRANAQRRHQHDMDVLSEHSLIAQTEIEALTEKLSIVRDLSTRAGRLRIPDLPEVDSENAYPDIDSATQRLAEARALDEERLLTVAGLRAERDRVDGMIHEVENSEARDQQSLLAHRREAAANIAAQAMATAADAILSERIDPLVAEITHRWKRVFVNRGELRLQHDGQLILNRGIHDIEFEQLSSGEKVIAVLATRLLVLSASTRASFLWLDEPLEHLDPSNRRLAASLMTTTDKNPRQLVITTYEERLARQLANVGTASVRFIKTHNDG